MSNPFTRSRRATHRVVVAAHLIAMTGPLLCVSIAARAADMPMKAPPAPAPAPTYQWTGCYVGLNGGAGAAASDVTTTVGAGSYLVPGDAAEVTNDGTGSANTTILTGGGQAGCNWQTGTVVVGLEGDFDSFRSTSSFYNNTNALPVSGLPFVIGQSVTTDYFATVRPRLGIAADRNFAYITGGVAFSRVGYTESYADGGAPPGIGAATAAQSLIGWTAGVGWEHAWAEHWTFKIEYLFASFPTTTAAGLIAGPGGTNPLNGSANLWIQTLRGGVNFKF